MFAYKDIACATAGSFEDGVVEEEQSFGKPKGLVGDARRFSLLKRVHFWPPKKSCRL